MHERLHKFQPLTVRRTGRYPGRMIKYRKQNALEPEKDAEFSLNLTPLLFFVVGYAAVKALLGAVMHDD